MEHKMNKPDKKTTVYENAGQPTKYKPEYCDGIISFMSGGASITEFAASISVSRQTVHNWTREHPEFFDAARIADTKSQAAMEIIGRAAMTGKMKIKENLWSFIMSRRFNEWKNKIGLEHTGKDGGPIKTIDLSKLNDEQLAKLEQLASAVGLSDNTSGAEQAEG